MATCDGQAAFPPAALLSTVLYSMHVVINGRSNNDRQTIAHELTQQVAYFSRTAIGLDIPCNPPKLSPEKFRGGVGIRRAWTLHIITTH